MVSQHPPVEARIIAELDSLGLSIAAEGHHPAKMTYADLERFANLPQPKG